MVKRTNLTKNKRLTSYTILHYFYKKLAVRLCKCNLKLGIGLGITDKQKKSGENLISSAYIAVALRD
ncbi:hypothetical protein PDY_09810 [Photobacterium damselae subsp. damselae]|nr:hypothetical protein PDY_09810 [Photobacterium damselae subsp. damselae]